MSIRKKTDAVGALQSELKALKEAQQMTPCASTPSTSEGEPASGLKLTFDQLTPTEQAAASLGVDPNAYKPIAFMNNQHYDSLIRANALDDQLARRIEAYRVVATTSK